MTYEDAMEECERKSNVSPSTWHKKYEGTPYYYGPPKPDVFINGKRLRPKREAV